MTPAIGPASAGSGRGPDGESEAVADANRDTEVDADAAGEGEGASFRLHERTADTTSKAAAVLFIGAPTQAKGSPRYDTREPSARAKRDQIASPCNKLAHVRRCRVRSRYHDGTVAGSSKDRITSPVDLTDVARETDRALQTSSEVRRHVPLAAVPWLTFTLDQLRELPLDTRAGYVVSLIDGRSTVEMISVISGMDIDEVTGIFAKLLELGAIELRGA
jgi:hypothetical protein